MNGNGSMGQVFYYTMLAIHIASGGAALITGLIPLFSAKGGKLHRRAGLVFYYAMMAVAASAFVIAVGKHLNFLLAVAVFSFYMNYMGRRVLKNRGGKFMWFDWLPVAAGLVTGVYLVSTLQIVAVVFGGILVSMAVQDIIMQLRGDEAIKKAAKLRVLTHISRMVGTYIATSTAFLVVNINFVKPGWLLWLLPTAIGTPVIIYFTSQWRAKLKPAL
ncbi:MAG TPA: hypothetical protein VG603_11540 [Chitinophagales bacterium]|nr:hypothetical protein [Chitinophagales bacterium]